MAVMVVVVLMSTVNNGCVNQTIEYSITFGGAHMVYSLCGKIGWWRGFKCSRKTTSKIKRVPLKYTRDGTEAMIPLVPHHLYVYTHVQTYLSTQKCTILSKKSRKIS